MRTRSAETKATTGEDAFASVSSARPGGPGGRWKRRLALLLAAVLLVFAALMVAGWFALRSASRNMLAQAPQKFEWEGDLSAFEPSHIPPETVLVGEPLVRRVLPQVLAIADAVESEGRWILMDDRSGKIHFLDRTGRWTGSVGRKGPGPGEMERPMGVTVQDTLLWVLNQRGSSLDRFSVPSGFQERRALHGGGCLAGLARGFRAADDTQLVALRLCPPSLPGPSVAWIESVHPDGSLEPIASLALGGAGSRRLTLGRQPALAAGHGRIFLGSLDVPCLMVFTGEGIPAGRRCLPEYDRPRTPEEERSKLEGRFRGVTRLGFLPVQIPDYLPWYDGLFAVPSGVVVKRVRTEDQRDLVLLPHEGPPSATREWFPAATFVGETTILTARDLLQGTEVTLYRSPWS